MRRVLITILLLSSSAAVAPAFALQTDDVMSAWKASSEKERSDLLKQLFGDRESENARIRQCMDETSKIPGHTDLNIGDVAKVCATAGAGEPV